MLNFLWGIMLLIGIIFGSFSGTLGDVGNGMLSASKEAIQLCIVMLGVMGFWNGIMEIAKQSGLIEQLTTIIKPILRYLFPSVPDGDPTEDDIATNMIANMLGLGWAATPSGLRAMQGLQRLKKDAPAIASDDMCMFLVINISSLQLIPMNMIAYRSEYGSVNATAIVAPALIATTVNTIAAVLFGVLARKKHSMEGYKP